MQPNTVVPGSQSSTPTSPNIEPTTPLGGPGVTSSQPTISANSFRASSSRPRMLKMAILMAIFIILIAGGIWGFGQYQKKASVNKFNALALQITQQELDGAKSFTQFAAASNEFGNLLSISNPTPKLTDLLNAKVDTLRSLTDTSCKAKTSELTSASIIKQASSLNLSTSQHKYITDWSQIIGDLQTSDYSNSNLCDDGALVTAFAENFAALIPGLITLGSVKDSATTTQINSLKQFTILEISDKDKLTQGLPATEQFLETLKSILSDSYYELQAVQQKDAAAAQKYALDLTSLTSRSDSDNSALSAELSSFDKKRNDVAIKASNEEIAAIAYQKAHKSGNADMQLDYVLPSFRIVEAEITNYSDSHNSNYPVGSSIDDISQLDTNLQQLKDEGHLSNLTYSSLGSDDSGFSLSAKLSNGTQLNEKVEPNIQTI